MSDKVVCRTAPATPGMSTSGASAVEGLKSVYFIFVLQCRRAPGYARSVKYKRRQNLLIANPTDANTTTDTDTHLLSIGKFRKRTT